MNKALKIFWLGICSAGILSNPFISYPGRDSGIFLYIGSLILKGKIPYLDVWENKGPLIFYLNALGLALTDGSRWGIWLIEFLFILISSAICYSTLKKIMSEISALLGTFIFVLAAGNVLQGGNFSEEYSLLFSFIAALSFLKSVEKPQNGFFNVVIGVALGCNMLLRPNNISVQIAIAGAYFLLAFMSKNWRLLFQRAVQIMIGMCAALLPVILYFAAKGALSEALNVVIVFNAQYSEGGGLARILEGIANAARGIGFLWMGVAAIGYVLALTSLFKREAAQTLLGSLLLVLVIGLPIEAALSAASGKNYPHYFIGWSLYVGMLCAYAAYAATKKIPSHSFSAPLAVALIVAAFATHLDAWKNYGAVIAQMGKPNAQFDYRDAVADYIQQHTSPEEKVLVWGFRPIVNFAAQRESPATYLPYPLSHVDTPLARRWAEEFYAQLVAHPPVLIINMIEPADRERIPDLDPEIRKGQKIKWKEVVLAHNYKNTLEFIQQRYVRVERINGNDVYRLNESARK